MDQKNKARKIEIIAVGITGLSKFILMDWLELKFFYIVAVCLFWGVYIYIRQKRDPQILAFWGFQKKNLKKSFTYLLPFALLAVVGILIYGYLVSARFLNWHVIPIVLLYPLWGVVQQFMVLGLIGSNLKELSKHKWTDWHVIIIVSLIFSWVHYGSISLMIYVFFMEMIFGRVYLKWNNIWVLGLYHGVISGLFLFYVLERDLWTELWMVFG